VQIAAVASRGKRLVLIGGLARAGKSFAAQVLKELLCALGRQAHVVSLDGWLKPKDQRSEGAGVFDRFNLPAAGAAIAAVAGSKAREMLREPLYDRAARSTGKLAIEHSIGPQDILIVEGVPALLMEGVCALSDTLKVYIGVAPQVRTDRLAQDYAWRGEKAMDQVAMLSARERDEVPVVEQSQALADFSVFPGYVKEKE